MGIASARYIAARRIDRDLLLPGDQAGQDLDLGILDRLALCLGKAADIGVGKGNVGLDLIRQAFVRCGDGGPRYDDLALPFVKPARQVACRGLASLFDLAQKGADCLCDVRLVCRTTFWDGLEILSHLRLRWQRRRWPG